MKLTVVGNTGDPLIWKAQREGEDLLESKGKVRDGSWTHAGVTEGTLRYRNEVTHVGDSVRGKAGQDKTVAFLPLPPASFLPPSTSHGLNHSEKPAATGAGMTLPGRERG